MHYLIDTYLVARLLIALLYFQGTAVIWCSIFATNFNIAFAKPLLPAGALSYKFKRNEFRCLFNWRKKPHKLKKAFNVIFCLWKRTKKRLHKKNGTQKTQIVNPINLSPKETETNEVYSANITHNLNTLIWNMGFKEHL